MKPCPCLVWKQNQTRIVQRQFCIIGMTTQPLAAILSLYSVPAVSLDFNSAVFHGACGQVHDSMPEVWGSQRREEKCEKGLEVRSWGRAAAIFPLPRACEIFPSAFPALFSRLLMGVDGFMCCDLFHVLSFFNHNVIVISIVFVMILFVCCFGAFFFKQRKVG